MYSRKTEWLIRNKEWKEVKGIGASILTTEENGKKQEQKRYYITNIAGGVEEFVRAVRRHWAIEISLDTECDIQRRCKQDIEQKCGKKLKYSKEISNLNTRIAAVQKDGRELIGKMLKEEWNVTKDMMVLSLQGQRWKQILIRM